MTDHITRRDFIDGFACAVAAATAPATTWPQATAPRSAYPPALHGLRGSRAEDYAVAHAVRDGAGFRMADHPIDEHVDCLVIGAGIGGLAAAHFVRKALPKARLLVLDNHDDFGGHARRNEFDVDGRTLIGYGGSESIQSPKSMWSPVALGLLDELGIRLSRFEAAIDTPLYPGLGMSSGLFFTREAFGQDRLVTGDPQRSLPMDIPAELHRGKPVAQFAADCPLTPAEQRSLVALYTEARDVMPGLDTGQKLELLRKISYQSFLEDYWRVEPAVARMFLGRTKDLYAAKADMIPALFASASGYPGFQGLGLGDAIDTSEESEPYIYHFPDGNASIARLLVRRMIPQAAAGTTMEDIVTARFHYDRLDRAGSAVRLRLSSTVVRLHNEGAHVDALYIADGKPRRVRARSAIYAGHFAMLPYICPDLPAAQRDAVARGVRAPLVYVTVAMRNWRPWARLGVHLINNPSGFYDAAKLDYPVSLGRYRFAKSPDEPILVHLSHIPDPPAFIADPYASLRAARAVLYSRPFADFETALRDELTRMLGPGGFDADRDIAAITVNRWGHGYAFPIEFLPAGAADTARAAVGGISLAGSDAAWTAYAHAAIDEAHRAAGEVAARG
ncbi:MAG TPA: NAD(P)-binding protein [Steroidobacteraceae bacterium]|nr:NAD(P)-binding protein [Steroidobacteraceae bacterium]